MIPSQNFPIISADELIITSFPCMGTTPRWVINFLRSQFANALVQCSSYPKRLFITRKGASYRRILNEEVLDPILQDAGFVSLQLETLSFEEQIRYFSSAEVILAPHGAGLANLVFAAAGTRVIEILPPRFPCICYWSLSNLLDQKYFFILGENDPKTFSHESEGYDHISIDERKVRDILRMVF
jgi:capsular polysaccharide biosynthesis protein